MYRSKSRSGLLWLAVLASMLLVGPGARMLCAQDELPAESLRWVPADAAFYSSSLRGREQWEIIARSRAWEKLKTMPAVQMGLQMFEAQVGQPGGPLDMARGMLELPENQELLSLLGEMFSDEVFVYGDASVGEFADLMMTMNGAGRIAKFSKQVGLDESELSEQQLQMRAVLDVLAEDPEKIDVPELVVGFKIKNQARAEKQLKRLEVIVDMLLRQQDLELAERLSRQEVGDAELLTFHLDGSLIPWEDARWEDIEVEEGEYSEVQEKLESLTLDISLGTYGDYLLLSVGTSNEHLEKLGQGELLTSREELKPLLAAGAKRFISINYVSDALQRQVGTTKEDLEGIAVWLAYALDEAEISDELREQILEDAQELAEDLKQFVPDPGAVLRFSFLTSDGTESFTYDWGENLALDASQPLSLLQHVGGTPLLATVGRGRNSPESYDLLAKWVKTAWDYFEEYGQQEFSVEQQEQFEQFRDLIVPLAKRADEINRTQLIPALADGQVGLVLDNVWSSTRWHESMPEAESPLPMLELALVFGVDDAKLLTEGMDGYRELVNEFLTGLKEISPDAPALQLPSPESASINDGTRYWYPLPEGLGLDPQVSPNAGVSEDVAVLTFSKEHTDRLLKETQLDVGSLLEDTERPLGTAGYFAWARMVEGMKPWLGYVETLAVESDDSGQAAFVFQNVDIAVELLQTLQTVASVTYVDGDVTITRSQTVWKDVQ